MSIKDASQAVLNLEEQAALGCAVVEASYLERYLETLILRFSDLPLELHDAFVPDSMSIGPKIRVLTDLVKPLLTKPAVKKTFTALMDRVGQSNTDRTTAVHGIWALPMPAVNALAVEHLFGPRKPPKAVKGRARPGGQPRELTAAKLLKLAEEINAANWGLHAFMDTHFPRIVELRPISPKQHLSRIRTRLRVYTKKTAPTYLPLTPRP